MTTTHASHTFPTDTTGLPSAQPTTIVELADGDTYDLHIAPVASTIDGQTVRMIPYNGSIPGPTVRVRQGSEITVRVRNDGDTETTVHWHGLRVDNRYDGVPHETQPPIPVGGTFDYRLRFPDDGLYWFHPHIREDVGIELGQYGTILVDPSDEEAWSPVDHEVVATLDDVLMEDGHIALFSTEGPTHTAMGRFGNVMLTSGKAAPNLDVRAGDVVRFFLVNVANTRLFNVSIPGADLKLVGGDSGRYELEELVDAVLLAPSERAIVDVLFAQPGSHAVEHNTPTSSYRLGTVTVRDEPSQSTNAERFGTLRRNEDLAAERDRLDAELTRPPDKTLVLDAEMPLLYGTASDAAAWTCPMHPDVISDHPGTCPRCGMKLIAVTPSAWTCPMHPDVVSDQPGTCPQCGMKLIPADTATGTTDDHTAHHDHTAHDGGMTHGGQVTHAAHAGHQDSGDGLEWEDLMPEINAQTDATNMIWKLVDAETGAVNHEIDWSFRVGDRVKLRLVNTLDSDHPMHHPVHIHGAGRFLVIARDDLPATNLVWKDTVLVRAGESVDLVLDVTSAGLWMLHCHIAEHNQNGMMFSFRVDPA
jgi:FtsP/CotA-like multicopper oxidase with cupredoxin domain